MYSSWYFSFLLLSLCFSSFVFSAPSDNTAAQEQVETGLLGFSLNLLEKLNHDSKPDENILISPLSIYCALMLVYLGSNGETKQEFHRVLQIPDDEANTKAFRHELKNVMLNLLDQTNLKGTNVSLAAGVFIQKDLEIKSDYQTKIDNLQGVAVENIDFSNALAATEHINKWISEKTKGQISKMFSEPLNPATMIILATTLYFNSKWQHKFSDYKTKTGKFNSGVGEVEVPFLSDTRTIPYYKNDALKYEAISLAYQDKRFRYYVILPDRSSDVHALTEALTASEFKKMVENCEKNKEPVELEIPKLKFEWSDEIAKSLKALGLTTLFSGNADLKSLIHGQVQVSDVKHVAKIEVYELGTEATAATVVHLLGASLPSIPALPPVKFIANRPYKFVIYDIENKVILFNGIVHKPTP